MWYKCDIVDYGVTMNLQKESLIEPGKRFPRWLKIVRSPGSEIKNYPLKNIFPNIFPNTLLDVISYMGVTNHRHYDRQYRK